jgi:hypothetical protein
MEDKMEKLLCGHDMSCRFHFKDLDKKVKEYCIACVCSKSGTMEFNAIKEEKKRKFEEKVKKDIESKKAELEKV